MSRFSVKQKPYVNDEVFKWVYDEAKIQQYPGTEKRGGIIFFRIPGQSHLHSDEKRESTAQSGCNHAQEGMSSSQETEEREMQKSIVSIPITQMMFLGLDGFRFPLAVFEMKDIYGYQLYDPFWKSVSELYMYGFRVMYACLDGSEASHSFMHICLGDKPTSFVSKSPCLLTDMVFIVDFAYVLKELRNNIMTSGVRQMCTKLLTLPSSYTVQWQMFLDVFQWAKENASQFYGKLTIDHFTFDSQSKTNYQLAEDVLNSEMLQLVKSYQKCHGEKRSALNGLVELLEQTSKLIDIFNDLHPVKSEDDHRLTELMRISKWFLDWQKYTEQCIETTSKEESKKFLTNKCHESVQACIQGFCELCHRVLTDPVNMDVTPALFNSETLMSEDTYRPGWKC